MKTILLINFLLLATLCIGQPIDPENPKLFRQQNEVLEKKKQSVETVPIKVAPGLYREWVNPVKRVRTPSSQAQSMDVINPTVRNPVLEQTFFKNKEWKSGRIVHVYEKSKDFETVLNPLSLKDFNRFIYQRNSPRP